MIIAVDGADITKLDLTDAIALIRGPRDTKVVLTIRREDQEPIRPDCNAGAHRDPGGRDQDVG